MTWSLEDVRTALATALESLAAVSKGHATMPSALTPPAAVVYPDPGTFVTYDTVDGAATLHLVALVVVRKVSDADAQNALDAFVGTDTLASIQNALDTAENAAWDSVQVGNPRNYGAYPFGDGASAISYLGCEFPLDVLVS